MLQLQAAPPPPSVGLSSTFTLSPFFLSRLLSLCRFPLGPFDEVISCLAGSQRSHL